VPKTAFYFIRSATTGFTASIFPYRSRVSLKEAFAGLELCAGKLACTVLRGPGPSNGVWLLGLHTRLVDLSIAVRVGRKPVSSRSYFVME
jgi:hypothetical protein